MTKETKLLESTTIMSLNNTCEEWADSILEKSSNFKRKNSESEITKYGFNIEFETKKLENKYIKFLERR